MARAEFLIQSLNLKKHPEGGYYREVYRSEEIIHDLPIRYKGHIRSLGTSIYYLLRGDEFSAFHKLKSDEIWHFYEGSALQLFVFDQDGKLRKSVLGKHSEKGERYQIIIPRNCWFAAQPEDPNGFTLSGCSVSPGFDFEDFQMAERKQLLETYPRYASLITKYTK